MLVAMTNLGSVWRSPFGRNHDDPYRFRRAAYYNTTGLQVGNEVRQRPKITGVPAPLDVAATIPRGCLANVKVSAQPGIRIRGSVRVCAWQAVNKVLFLHALDAPRKTDLFLLVLRDAMHGRVEIGNKSAGGRLAPGRKPCYWWRTAGLKPSWAALCWKR